MWESRCFGEISKTLWERWESCFWISNVSTPSPFPQLSGVSGLMFSPSFGGLCRPETFPTPLAPRCAMSFDPKLPDHVS